MLTAAPPSIWILFFVLDPDTDAITARVITDLEHLPDNNKRHRSPGYTGADIKQLISVISTHPGSLIALRTVVVSVWSHGIIIGDNHRDFDPILDKERVNSLLHQFIGLGGTFSS